MKGVATSGDRIGRYRLLERLGEGGMGVVHLGLDPDGRKVAVKVLRTEVAEDVTALRRLAREVDTMRRVHSLHVAEIIDADVTAEPPYIVTQFVPGRTLERTVREDGPMRGRALQRLAAGLAQALAAIHAAGIIHRDLKPGNVMFLDGEPIVIDFGIAQAVDATRLTTTGLVIGTPGYLAPEVIEGEDIGSPSDVHSWASTLAYAATGRAPFGSGTFESVFYKIMEGIPDLDGVPEPLLPLLRAAMVRHPAERPTAAKLAELSARIDMTTPTATRVEAPAQTKVFTAAAEPQRPPPRPAPPPMHPKDFKGLLPPAAPPPQPSPPTYQQPAYGTYGAPEPARFQPKPPRPDEPKPYGWYRLLSFLLLVGTVGLASMLPVIMIFVVLATLIILRVADRAAKGLESRRIRRGPSAGDFTAAILRSPLGIPRAMLSTVLIAPVGILLAVVVLLVLILANPSMTLTRAVSLSIIAFIVLQCIGPGSEGPRRQLARIWGVTVRRRDHALVTAGCLAVIVFVVVTFSLSQFPDLRPFDLGKTKNTLETFQQDLQSLFGVVG